MIGSSPTLSPLPTSATASNKPGLILGLVKMESPIRVIVLSRRSLEVFLVMFPANLPKRKLFLKKHNHTLLSSPLKKPEVFNEFGILVPPDKARPAGKKNLSNELISKTWPWGLGPVFSFLISWIQRGFVLD